MFLSEARLFVSEVQVRAAHPAPHIVVGITHPQTCLTLTGRLRALREAGFRVTLVSSPGELLDRTAAREGVEYIAIPIQRKIAPIADIVSLARLWWLLLPSPSRFSLASGATSSASASARMLRLLQSTTCAQAEVMRSAASKTRRLTPRVPSTLNPRSM